VDDKAEDGQADSSQADGSQTTDSQTTEIQIDIKPTDEERLMCSLTNREACMACAL